MTRTTNGAVAEAAMPAICQRHRRRQPGHWMRAISLLGMLAKHMGRRQLVPIGTFCPLIGNSGV